MASRPGSPARGRAPTEHATTASAGPSMLTSFAGGKASGRVRSGGSSRTSSCLRYEVTETLTYVKDGKVLEWPAR
jgi:hypothetical protein